MTPKVSVIVPIYQVEAYLPTCLDSLVEQTFSDLEVILVNDGSTDESGRIMEDYAASHPHFKVYHKENGGLGHARNFGAARATGDYITFLDSDDWVTADAYRKMVKTALATGSDIVCGNVARFNAKRTYPSALHQKVFHETTNNTHITRNPTLIYDTTSVNKLFKSTFWNHYGFQFPEGIYYEDIPVTIPAHYWASSVDLIGDVVYYWRSRDGYDASITQQRERLENFRDRLRIIQMLDAFFTDQNIHGALKEEKDVKTLSVDLRLFLNKLDRVDDEYLDAFTHDVAAYIEGMAPRVYQRLDAIDRLKYELIRHGEKEKLLEVLRFQKEDMKKTKVIKKGSDYFGNYPYKEEFSEELLQLNDTLPVVRKIESLRWDAGKLRVRGYNYIAQAEMKHRRDVGLTAYLKNQRDEQSTPIPVAVLKRTDVTYKRGVKTGRRPLKRMYHYDFSGYELVIDFGRQDIAALGEGRLELWFQLQAGGLTRTFRAGGPVAGGKPRTRRTIMEDFYVTPRYNQAKDLVLQRGTVDAAVEAIQVDGTDIHIKGWHRHSDWRGPLTFEQKEGPRFEYSLVYDEQDGEVAHFQVTVDARELADVETKGPWQAYLSRMPLFVASQVQAQEVVLRQRELHVGATRAGQLKVQCKPIAPRLEQWRWSDDGLEVVVESHESLFVAFERVESIHLSLQHNRSGRDILLEESFQAPSGKLAGRLTLKGKGRTMFATGKWTLWLAISGTTQEGYQHTGEYKVRAAPATFDSYIASGLKYRPYRATHGEVGVRVNLNWPRLEDGPRRREAVKRVLYPLFRLLPMRKHTVVFESLWGGSYSCNPRAIYEYMEQNEQAYRPVWLFKNENTPVSGHAKAVRMHSWRYYYYLATAKYFINNANFPDFYKKRNGAVEVHTMHGTPLKTMGLDIPGETDTKHKKNRLLRRCGRWDYLLSPSRYVTDLTRRCFDFQKEVLEVGFPRNDCLKSSSTVDHVDKIKERLNIPADKKVILYAPTWRTKQSFQLQLDLRQMQQALGDEYILLLRLHYFTPHALDLTPYRGFVYNVSAYDDIADLYLISDLLITDYSSVMFDYANLGRPMLFFTYDLRYYRDELRGMYVDIEKEAPGPLVETTDGVIDAIQDIENYDQDYGKKLAAFRAKYCEFDEGDACRRVVESVFAKPEKRRHRLRNVLHSLPFYRQAGKQHGRE